MKKATTIIICLIVLSGKLILSQEYKIPVDNPNDATLQLSNFSGTITITGYSGNEVIISPAEKVPSPPDRAKGLKPVYSNGIDNTGIGINIEKEGTRIIINCLLPFTNRKDYSIKVPENVALSINSRCENSSDVHISNMKAEIEIQTCHSINLQKVTGPLVLNTIAGNIDITFSTVNTGKPFAINTVSGEIDITLPQNLSADIEMGSVSGSMYSDFDFSATDKNLKHVGGNHLSYKLNGGGTSISIVTVSGNIYLRKGA